ncbi:MAG: OmpA family protein [Deltaproteobacteria bacterium]|nr:OmpA family protein [Deltaproteobacteria bacterium]
MPLSSARFVRPLTLTVAALGLSARAEARPMIDAHPSLPPRPTTYLVDDKVSEGKIENFRSLYVKPDQVNGLIGADAKARAPTLQSLPINNEFSSYAEISVDGVRIGVIDPMSNGAIHELPAGIYRVSFKLQNGYVEERSLRTVVVKGPIVPGGRPAQTVVSAGAMPSWHTDPTLGLVAPPPPEKPRARRAQLAAKRIEINEAVHFALGSAEIDAQSHALLDEVAEILTANPSITKLEVQGHTDSSGDPAQNRALSQARAEAVVGYLVGKGVAADRLSAKGFGPDMPLGPEASEEAKAANRRVELHVLAQASAEPAPAPPAAPPQP